MPFLFSNGAAGRGSFNHMLNAFMKIFRLEVLGDFDLTEMEGLGEAGVCLSSEGGR